MPDSPTQTTTAWRPKEENLKFWAQIDRNQQSNRHLETWVQKESIIYPDETRAAQKVEPQVGLIKKSPSAANLGGSQKTRVHAAVGHHGVPVWLPRHFVGVFGLGTHFKIQFGV